MTDESESDGTARVSASNARLCVAIATFLLVLATLTPVIVGSTWGLVPLFCLGLGVLIFAYVGGVESERAGR